MKIKNFTIIFTLLFLFGFTQGTAVFTGGGIQVTEKSDKETKLTANVGKIGSEINGINARFCNNGLENLNDKITQNIGQLEEGEICVVIKNDTEKDAKVNLSFSNQTITPGGNLSCDRSGESTFAGFINEPESKIEVAAGDYVTKNFKIQFPLGAEGKQGGCLFYNAEKKDTGEKMLNIVVGKALYLDYFVGKLGEIENKIDLEIIDKKLENNELIVKVGAKNKGNIDLNTNTFGSLTNMFGIKKEFSITGEVIRVNNSLVFELNFGQLPNYKGLFDIKIETKHKPYFDFDISSFDINEDVLKEKTSKIKTSFFQIPRLVLGTILIIIFLLILAFRKPKQKVVYVKQPEQK